MCAGHRLQNCINTAFCGKSALDKLLSSCSKLVGPFTHSALATHALLEETSQAQQEALETCSRCHRMLEQCIPDVGPTVVRVYASGIGHTV